jgi:small ligand-binding sensory domain FIST
MIAAGTGLAVGGAADNAALEASLEAIERSGADRADLALVFVTGDAHTRAHEALHAVRRVTGAPVVVGCSGTGILTERREVEDDLAVAVLAVRCERLVATPFSFDAGRAARSRRRARPADSPTVAEGGCALVLPDALGCNPPALLSQLHDALGFVPVLGAAPPGAPMF